MILDKGS